MNVVREPIKILVVEDNVITAKHIAATLKNFGWIVTGICNSASAAMASIEAERPHLALLDVNLNRGIDGVQIASILKLEHQIPFIFLTSYSDQETLNRILKVHPHGYLQKPFNPLELEAMVNGAFQARTAQPTLSLSSSKPAKNFEHQDYLFVKNNRKIDKLEVALISVIESSGRYSYIYCDGKKKISNTSLKQLLSRLQGKNFVRVHKSYLVNLAFVESISANSVTICGREIPVGKQYREGLIGGLDIV